MPLLLVLDGNSLLHRAYHAGAGDGWVDDDGNPIWALRGFFGYMARAAAHLRPDAVVVGFDCPDESARRTDYPAYKAHRPDKAEDLTAQLLAAPALLRDAGVCTVVPRAYEADDVLASAAATARAGGWQSVLMTSDRDAFALIDDATSVLRVRNGGFDEAVLVDAAALPSLYGVHPWQYRDFAALRGDPSDNLHGVRRFGAATAAKLLAAFGTIEAAWDAGVTLVRDAVGAHAATSLTAPGAREIVERNRRLMSMRHDLEIPDLATARLPLSRFVMRQALRARGINLGPSLWALTGGAPPAEPEADPAPEFRPWVFRGSLTARREPTPGQMALF
ncbi:flap endonuclease [Actinoplanes bogorensis]|uniref:5'-3' exonuclease n=1 Tax=Paractinoplanes bogorensis TaxID=1610840 RepID=A0ABS5YMJ2_9ACTN|nr:5'-3' exonuclease H3TH domain-containing protein [Actinoplanes bogorensis]MBU2664598.1 flap endonuclease [Actinoplanes bogorensis]